MDGASSPGAILVADGLTKGLQGQAFQAFVERLKCIGEKETDPAEAQDAPRGRPEKGRAVAAAAALAAGAGLLLGAGQRNLGLTLALCACALIQGRASRKDKNEMSKRDEEPTKRGGGAKRSAQDDKPTGGVTPGSAQEGKSRKDGASQDLGVGVGDPEAPGIRALRMTLELSHDAEGQTPLQQGEQRGARASAAIQVEGPTSSEGPWRVRASAAAEGESAGSAAASPRSRTSWRASSSAAALGGNDPEVCGGPGDREPTRARAAGPNPRDHLRRLQNL